MRAAIVRELGRPPEVTDAADPSADDDLVLEVLAAPLNPIDLAVAAGRNPAGHPALPYVPGCEAVGRADGELVWAFGHGLGILRDGTMAERVAVPADALVPVPDDADPALAGALGIAGMAGWMPFAWRAPVREGETVVVLGATGAVGSVAVQAARVLGAGRVVAVGRNEERLTKVDADVRVRIDRDLGERLRKEEPTLVMDALCGEPLEAVVEVAARGARIVQMGQSAGPTATLPSTSIRFKGLELLGYSNFNVPPDVLRLQYDRLVRHALAGDIRVDVERIPLDDVASAWERQAQSPGRKLVIVP